MGQSCGGFLSITLGADPRVKTIGMFNSGVQPNRAESNGDALQKVHGPVLLINGAERDFLTPASVATFDLIKNVPAFYGARHGAGHTATVDHPGGGDVRRRQVRSVHELELGRSRQRLQGRAQ